jgi:hypothetical protein
MTEEAQTQRDALRINHIVPCNWCYRGNQWRTTRLSGRNRDMLGGSPTNHPPSGGMCLALARGVRAHPGHGVFAGGGRWGGAAGVVAPQGRVFSLRRALRPSSAIIECSVTDVTTRKLGGSARVGRPTWRVRATGFLTGRTLARVGTVAKAIAATRGAAERNSCAALAATRRAAVRNPCDYRARRS